MRTCLRDTNRLISIKISLLIGRIGILHSLGIRYFGEVVKPEQWELIRQLVINLINLSIDPNTLNFNNTRPF
jgi:hypothetical protein